MVVVDNARKMISKTIDIAVTSVLQTTAGKMIFGRFDDRVHAVHDAEQPRSRRKDNGAPREGASAARADPGNRSGLVGRPNGYNRTHDHESFRHSSGRGAGNAHGPRKKPAPAASSSCCWKARRSWCTPSASSLHCPSVSEIVVALRAEDLEWARGLIQQEHLAQAGALRRRRRQPAAIGGECAGDARRRIPTWWRCTTRCGRSSIPSWWRR